MAEPGLKEALPTKARCNWEEQGCHREILKEPNSSQVFGQTLPH